MNRVPNGRDELKTASSEVRTVEVVLPAEAIQLLYDVLGHFPHEPGSWSNVARGNCSVGLWDAHNQRKASE